MRALWRLLAALSVILPLLGGGTPAVAQDVKPCECLECLKVRRLATMAAGKAYVDRWPEAQKELQGYIDRYNNNPVYREELDAEGQTLFCRLWDTLEDERDAVRKKIEGILGSIKAANPKCLPEDLADLTTNLATCEINPFRVIHDEIFEPCYELHLAALGHELTHKEDCEWNQTNDWAKDTPDTLTECNTAFFAKATPTPEQVMAYAQLVFRTEEHAHRIESQIQQLLANQLAKRCKTGDYSSEMPRRLPEAAKFLKRARKYEPVLPK